MNKVLITKGVRVQLFDHSAGLGKISVVSAEVESLLSQGCELLNEGVEPFKALIEKHIKLFPTKGEPIGHSLIAKHVIRVSN